jgi:hypothetical protein
MTGTFSDEAWGQYVEWLSVLTVGSVAEKWP